MLILVAASVARAKGSRVLVVRIVARKEITIVLVKTYVARTILMNGHGHFGHACRGTNIPRTRDSSASAVDGLIVVRRPAHPAGLLAELTRKEPQ